MAYVPERGDLVWLDFNPQLGHEQAGRRPALTISPGIYNKKVGLALFCPVSTQVKGYPFEVLLQNDQIKGAVLSDQIKSLDWKSRKAQFIIRIANDQMREVFAKITVLMT